MKNLQSKQLPFRTLQQFHQPLIRQKISQGIKIFPRQQHRQNILNPSGGLPSIVNYISKLNEAKQLPRKIHNRHQYFSLNRVCKRHSQRLKNKIIKQIPQYTTIDDRQQQTKTDLRMNTILSNNTMNKSMIEILNNKIKINKKLQYDRSQFDLNKNIIKQQKQKQMRFSFYNTIQKSQYFNNKFKNDQKLQQRKTNKYQNIVRRKIKQQQILEILNQTKIKWINSK